MSEKITNKESILTKQDISKAFFRWWLMSHLAYNYQRMQGGAFASVIGPILKRLYPNKLDEIKEGLKRHMMFFNTEPRWGAVIPGMVVAMEEQRALNPQAISDSAIIDFKSSLMGPMAGIGDTITQALFKPILLSICIGWASAGNILGAILFGAISLGFDFIVTRSTFFAGYKLGTEAVSNLFESGTFKKLNTLLSVLGLFVLGVMICKFVTADIILKFTVNGKAFAIKDLISKILPKAIPLIITISAWQAMIKGVSIAKVLIYLFVISLVGGFLGILG